MVTGFVCLLLPLVAEAFDEREFLVKDIRTGVDASQPERGMAIRNGLFVFSANDGTHGAELWATDAAGEGTVLVKDIRPGAESSSPQNFSKPVNYPKFVIGTGLVDRMVVFFAANDGTHGTELWATDGTADGTFLVTDIRTIPGPPNHDPLGSSFPYSLTVLNGKLVFGANDGETGVELWTHDPATGNTFQLRDIYPGDDFTHSLPNYLIVVGNFVFFSASDNRQAGTGTELWKTDGTTEGTVLVADVRPGNVGSGARELVNLNGTLIFVAYNGVGWDNQLWRSDGAGASLIHQFGEISSPPDVLRVSGNFVYFAATNHLLTGGPFPAHGQELWRSDGTGGGTAMVRDINPTTESGIAFGSAPRELVDVNGRLFFTADDGASGRELWTSDGSPGGTVRVADVRPGPTSSDPFSLTACGRLLYWTANDGTTGREIWRIPPESLATLPVAQAAGDLGPGDSVSFAPFLGFGGRHLLVALDDGVKGTELWAVEYVTFLVTNTSDSGQGSLRKAIEDANTFINPHGCVDRIGIDIAGPGPHLLGLQSQLPAITDPVTITDPLYNPQIQARFLADGNLAGVNVSGLIILTKDTEVIGIGFTRVKTGIKLNPDGANVNLQGLLFLQISDIGIEANLNSTGVYQFRENRFLGGMAFGTKVNVSGMVEATIHYRKNYHEQNQVAIEANEQLDGSLTWTVFDNISKNGGTGGRFNLRVAGNKDFARNRWEGHAQVGLTYATNVAQNVRIIVKADGDVAVGNGFEGVRADLRGTGEVRFTLLNLTSSGNSGDGIGVFAEAGLKSNFQNDAWTVEGNGRYGAYVQGGSALFRVGWEQTNSVYRLNSRGGGLFAAVEFGFSLVGNEFSGNGGEGLVLAGDTTGNVTSNLISGNTGPGVLLQDNANPTLTNNTINGNGAGLVVSGTAAAATFASNVITANNGLGLDLGGDGVTPNDPGDTDGMQNFPLLHSATSSAGVLQIAGSLDSTANSQFVILFFANAAPDLTLFGEGEVFLGSLSPVTTDNAGVAAFEFDTTAAVPVSHFVTALATRAGRISEFSPVREVTGPDGDDDGLPDAWEILHFTSTSNPDGAPSADADGDGSTNSQEFNAGTLPLDAASALRVTFFTREGDLIRFRFLSMPYRLYDFESATALQPGAWQRMIPFIPGTGGEIEVSATRPPGIPREFFRVRTSF